MIIPIGHDQEVRRYPWLTLAIIALCTLVQLYSAWVEPSDREMAELARSAQTASPDDQGSFEQRATELLERSPIWQYGYRTGSGLDARLITHAFVHEGWMHLIGNMLFLWLVGSALEDRWGRVRFLVFYLGAAAAAALCFDAVYRGPPTVLIGASGAVSGSMGAFLVYFSGTQITLWYWMLRKTGTFQIAAYLALPLWLADQILWAMLARSGSPGVATVAYEAHIGGFVIGGGVALVARMMFPRSALPHDDDDELVHDGALPSAIATGGASLERAPAPPRELDRYQQCLDAVERKDLSGVKMTASRVILDLARAHDHARILTLYRTIAGGLPRIPLTDGAFAAAAMSADASEDARLYLEIAQALLGAHPGSGQLPRVLWRAAEVYRAEGAPADEAATLRLLAERFARDELGQRAADELARRRPRA